MMTVAGILTTVQVHGTLTALDGGIRMEAGIRLDSIAGLMDIDIISIVQVTGKSKLKHIGTLKFLRVPFLISLFETALYVVK